MPDVFDFPAFERSVQTLNHALGKLRFAKPITHVYNPLEYARKPHSRYVETYARKGIDAVWLGMNPGPFGMAQTGVPFGEVNAVADWLRIEGEVSQPENQNAARPIEGFACRRSEVSGQRLWGFARSEFATPEAFFERFFVVNYCPLVFMEASGRNFTPDKLPSAERTKLFDACDQALRDVVGLLQPKWVIGVGAFAEARAIEALGQEAYRYGRILHPSPASPAANKDWAGNVKASLKKMGLL